MRALFFAIMMLAPAPGSLVTAHSLALSAEKIAIITPGTPPRPTTPEVAQVFQRDKKVILSVSGVDEIKARIKWWVRSDDGRQSPDYEVFDGGKICAIWGSPGKYEALVTVGVIENGDIKWIDIEHKFSIEDGHTPQPPQPGPQPPQPGPSPDIGNFSDVVSKVSGLLSPIRDDNLSEGLKIIAKAYTDHANQALTNVFKDQNELADSTSNQIVYELGLQRYLRYRPAFTRIRELLSTLLQEGRLKNGDMNTWARAWYAIAEGALKTVPKSESGSSNDATKK